MQIQQMSNAFTPQAKNRVIWQTGTDCIYFRKRRKVKKKKRKKISTFQKNET